MPTDPVSWAFLVAYFTVVGCLAVFGFHRYQMVYLYFRNRRKPKVPKGMFSDEGLPAVTVQLPCFNEMYVVERLVDAVARLDYPREKLEVQILDDSTDETVEIAARKVEEWRKKGLDICLLHRDDRTGYKAGALEAGLEVASGELVAVFDADFVPEPGFLRQTVHYFTDPKVGLVQTRWGHLNRDYSLLTQVEGILLDGHFQIEHTARNRSGRFFNFNGTAGIWRRETIIDAGGWEHDTLTEDIDLSYRAQVKGWEFVYLPDVVSPAEVPADINAFKTQQHRWTKGAAQCAKKLLPMVWRAKNVPLKVKVEATFHLTMNVAYVLMVLLCLLMLPVVAIRFEMSWMAYLLIDVPFFIAATTSVFSFYIYSQREVYPQLWFKRLRYIPLVVSVGIGMSINNARAVFEGFFGKQSEFVRTPKHGIEVKGETFLDKRYGTLKSLVPFVELAFGVYFVAVFGLALSCGRYMALPFIALFLFGFFYVSFLSFRNQVRRPAPVVEKISERLYAQAS